MRRKRSESSEPGFYFEQAISMEPVRPFVGMPIPKGLVVSRDHEMVKRFPASFRLLGPHPDQEEVTNA